MIRTRRAFAVFLLALTVALPVAALPVQERAEPWRSFLTSVWQHVTAVFEASRLGMDPDGTPTTVAPPEENPVTTQDDADSRLGMDPNG